MLAGHNTECPFSARFLYCTEPRHLQKYLQRIHTKIVAKWTRPGRTESVKDTVAPRSPVHSNLLSKSDRRHTLAAHFQVINLPTRGADFLLPRNTKLGAILELLIAAALSLICLVTCCFIGRRIELAQEAVK
jgi:hypothetical protein